MELASGARWPEKNTMKNSTYSSNGYRNVSAESHREAAEKFALTEARRKYGRTGRVGALTAGPASSDRRVAEWSAFIGKPAVGGGTAGHTIGLNTFAN